MRNLLKKSWVFSFIANSSLYVLFSMHLLATTVANKDLRTGSYVLSMDEKIIFDGTAKILHPSSFIGFLQNVIDGGDQRYGRILWNLAALFSFLPEQVFGEPGQIVATRILMSVMVALGLYILISTLIQNRLLRIVGLLAGLTAPFSLYYSSMPKPEPILILSLALFVRFHKKYESKKSFYWVFLGIFLGAKISALPLFISILLFVIYDSNKKEMTKRFIAILPWILVGFGISVPSLSILCLIVILSITLFKRYSSDKYAILMVTILLIISTIFFRQNIYRYLSWTVFGSAHGLDDSKINALSWIRFISETWFNSNSLYVLLFILPILVYVYLVNPHLKNNIFESRIINGLFCGSLFTIFLIIIDVKRLWGMYLWIPYLVLMIINLVILEKIFKTKRMPVHFLLVIWIVAFALQSTSRIEMYKADQIILASRTQNESFKIQEKQYQQVKNNLMEISKKSQKKLIVKYDPIFFQLPSTSQYEIQLFWGPYLEWESNADVLIFSKYHTDSMFAPTKDRSDFNTYVVEQRGIERYFIEKGGSCKMTTCYFKYSSLPDNGSIWISKNLT